MSTNQTTPILPSSYFKADNVVLIAQDLLGKKITTKFNGHLTSGVIVETEAYCSINDRASHAHGNRRTKRNNQMYSEGGTIYIYICYFFYFRNLS